MWLTGSYPQLCHQMSELVNSSKQMSSSLSQCLTVFIQQEQVFSLVMSCGALAAELDYCSITSAVTVLWTGLGFVSLGPFHCA